jgi:acyl-CoA-binding protein
MAVTQSSWTKFICVIAWNLGTNEGLKMTTQPANAATSHILSSVNEGGKCSPAHELVPARVVHVPQNASTDQLKLILYAAFELDDEPVIIKGAEPHLLPGVSENRWQYWKTLCGAQLEQNVTSYIDLLGGVHHPGHVPLSRDCTCSAHSNYTLWREACDYQPYYFVKGTSCDRFLNKFGNGIFAEWQHPPADSPNGSHPTSWPKILGAMGGTMSPASKGLHKHGMWPQGRVDGIASKRWRKYVSYTAVGRRTWILYPSSAFEKHYGNAVYYNDPLRTWLPLNPFQTGGVYDSRGPTEAHLSWKGLPGWIATVDTGDFMLFPSNHFHSVHNDVDSLSFTFPTEMDMLPSVS